MNLPKIFLALLVVYLQLAIIFYELEKNNLAIDYYIRAINIYNKNEPSSNIALSYYGLGKCYLKKNNISFAEIYFEKATDIYKKLNFLEAIEWFYNASGDIDSIKRKGVSAKEVSVEIEFSDIQNGIDNIKNEKLKVNFQDKFNNTNSVKIISKISEKGPVERLFFNQESNDYESTGVS